MTMWQHENAAEKHFLRPSSDKTIYPQHVKGGLIRHAKPVFKLERRKLLGL